MENLKKLWQKEKESAIQDYLTFLTYPSISSSVDHQADVKACCQWLAEWMKKRGLPTEIWDTKGHPTIFSHVQSKNANAPTILLYGHYDVQPVEPLDEWTYPPFKPTLLGNEVYARGAQDNKGQCFYTLLAVSALLKEFQTVPIHVKCLIEGEEEIGSPHLPELLERKKKELQADYVVIVDMGMKNSKTPAVTLGARGIVTMDLVVSGTKTDLHSGSHGGLAYNPLWALVEILSSLKNPKTGEVTILGFYEDIVPLKEEEKKSFTLSFNEEEYVSLFGQKPTGGEKAFSPAERAGLRPTLEINGIGGGYHGTGFKTVIPAKAIAKLSCRLVPNQNPGKIGQLVSSHLQKMAPPGIQVAVHVHPGSGEGIRANPHSKIAEAFRQAYQEVFHEAPDYLLEGGSIPITTTLARIAGGEPVLVGVGLPDDQIHAPNEHFGIDRLEKGFLSIARAILLLEA